MSKMISLSNWMHPHGVVEQIEIQQDSWLNGIIQGNHFLSVRLLKLVLIISALSSGAAVAQQMDESNHTITSITLSSPETERDMLKTYFELPSTPLPDETARDTFMRRAKLEIGQLLATDGYFTPTVTPRPVSELSKIARL